MEFVRNQYGAIDLQATVSALDKRVTALEEAAKPADVEGQPSNEEPSDEGTEVSQA